MGERNEGEIGLLDFAKIALPSDRITLGSMRRRAPQCAGEECVRSLGVSGAADAHCTEVVLCERAYARATGEYGSARSVSREELMEGLDEVYQEYGISRGMHETAELVRRLEAEAARQGQDVRRGRGTS